MNTALEISAAKLRTPRLGADLVPRPRLEGLLDKSRRGALTLVCAPAGFGKTTLLAEWLAARSLPTAWVSLDSDDSDITAFTRLLISAIRTVFDGACEATLGVLRSPQPLKPEALAMRLCNDIDALPGFCVVVLDDYHTIADGATHQMLAALLDRLPPTLHLAIATRSDPPLPLARLLARGQMTDVRVADLRFNRDEIEQFLAHAAATAIDATAIETLAQRTEGWAAGLRLASLSLSGESDYARLNRGLTPRANQYIMEYLLDEVLSRQRPEIQDFLLTTSILESFNASLAAAVCGDRDARALQDLIEEIDHANLFLVTLDETQAWYRYHHLFRDLLRHKLGQTVDSAWIEGRHRRASEWFAAHGAITEAIHHALQAGDETRAARLVEANTHGAVLQQDRLAIKHWLDMLPPHLAQQRPGLLAARCWVLAARDNQDAMAPVLQQADAALAQPDLDLSAAERRSISGDIALFWAQYWLYLLRGDLALAAAERAMADIPPEHGYARGYATLYRAMALQTVGRKDEALGLLQATLERHPAMPFAQRTMIYTGLMVVNFAHGDLARAAEAARAALPPPDERDRYRHMISHVYPVLGHIYYELNNLDAAIEVCLACPKFERSGHLWGEYESGVALTLCHAARGEMAEARRILDELLALVHQFDDPALLDEAQGLTARLALIAGDLDTALAWADAPSFKQKGLLRLEAADITRARIWVASGTPGYARRVIEVLREPISAAEMAHSSWRLALLLALIALALETLGEWDAALDAMRRSVSIAAPYRYARTYLDLGSRAAALLHRLAEQGVERDYIGRLLPLFPPVCPTMAASAAPPRHAALIEPLTTREMQVLELLAQRLSDKEIAQTLVISPLTARSHVSHVFDKLGVNNRRAAVEQARRLGLLRSS
ncbi:MAG: LuxR C-terminal-related transcriptional regulator [Anaerolineae bacterium]